MKISPLRWLVILSSLALFVTSASANETIQNPQRGTPEFAISQALKAAIAGDFKAYLETVHPDDKTTKSQRDQRKNYEWKRFKKQAKWYLLSDKAISFVVASRKPDGAKAIRLYIQDQKHKKSMPRPVKLKKAGDSWKITTNSL
jgi:hypothetical protein